MGYPGGSNKKSLARGSELRLAHQLAERLGKSNVNKMLRNMTVIQWRRWQVFMRLAPTGEELANVRAGLIVKAIVDAEKVAAHRRARRSGLPQLAELLRLIPRFGDTPEYIPSGPQKPKDQKAMWENLKMIFTAGKSRKT